MPFEQAETQGRAAMYYEELSRYLSPGLGSGVSFLAVGWLAAGRPYATGPVPEGVSEKLGRLCLDGETYVVSCGVHSCELCLADPAVDTGEITVPDGGSYLVCPSMVLHYIEVHGYQPPQRFIDAVLACPDPDTAAYQEAMRGAEQCFREMWSEEPPDQG